MDRCEVSTLINSWINTRQVFRPAAGDRLPREADARTIQARNRKPAAARPKTIVVPNAGIKKPPIAGPTMLEIFNWTPPSALTAGQYFSSTTSGINAVQAGAVVAIPEARIN